MPAKVAINVGDSVMWLYQGSTNHYKVIRKYSKTAWIQKNYKSKYLKNENPVIRHVPLKHLKNINRQLISISNVMRRRRERETAEERRTRLEELKLIRNTDEHRAIRRSYNRKLRQQQPEVCKGWREKTHYNRKPGNWRILLKQT